MAETNLDSHFISIRPAVEFTDVHDQYCYTEDLICHFKFNDYIPQEGDRIAIFKLGWSFVKDYVVFEWAPTGNSQNRTVTFNKHILPKNNVEIYQICYISGQNELHGASSSFQFSSENNKDAKCVSGQLAQMVDPSMIATSTAITPVDNKQMDSEEVRKLKEENLLLRETLALIVTNKNVLENKQKQYDEEIETLKKKMDCMALSFTQSMLDIKNADVGIRCVEMHKICKKEIEELKKKIVKLESALNLQQREIDMFKSKIIEGGQEYKKLYLEKLKLEKKIKQKSCNDKVMESTKIFDIEDLKTLPPFPFPQKI